MKEIKMNYRLTVLVGLGFMTVSAFWQLYDFVIPLIMLKAFNVGDTLAGVVMSADNVLALFMLPFFGMLSDKTTSPIGRRMPYILGGSLLAVASMMVIPLAVERENLGLFIFSLAVVLLAMSTYRSP